MHPSIQHVHCDGDPTPETIELINKLAQAAYNTPMKTPTEPTTTLPSKESLISKMAEIAKIEHTREGVKTTILFEDMAHIIISIACQIIEQLQKENEELKDDNKRLNLMIENGLGLRDIQNDI